jgi:histidinol phosphatase-like enzyme
MTPTEMYTEIVEQEMADIFLDEDGYIIDDYSIDNVIEIEYDV